MNAGFSLVLLAETYCQGDILVGPPLTPAQMLDSAAVRFKQAVSIGDLLSFYATVTRVGNTSVTVHVEVYAERNPQDLYVVKVKGQSMIDGHIADGDYVVIRKRETCENGDKVVAMVDRAMTLKKYQRKKDQIVLHPMNAAMEPIVVDPTRQDVQILGLLAGVIRKC